MRRKLMILLVAALLLIGCSGRRPTSETTIGVTTSVCVRIDVPYTNDRELCRTTLDDGVTCYWFAQIAGISCVPNSDRITGR